MRSKLCLAFTSLGASVAVVVLLATSHLSSGLEPAAASAFELSLDTDISDGGPCANIDPEITIAPGEAFQVGVCVSGLPSDVANFEFKVVYDDTIINAPEIPLLGAALDDNPDANAGATMWGDGLGENWTCDILNLGQQPIADNDPETGPGHGLAEMICWTLTDFPTLGDDEDAGVLAVISFNGAPSNVGTTSLEFTNVSISNFQALEIGSCNPRKHSTEIDCQEATVHVSGATIPPDEWPTPTPASGEFARPTLPPEYVSPTPTVTPALTGDETPEAVATTTAEPTKTLTPSVSEEAEGGGTDWLWPTVIGIVVAVVVIGALSLGFYRWRRGQAA